MVPICKDLNYSVRLQLKQCLDFKKNLVPSVILYGTYL